MSWNGSIGDNHEPNSPGLKKLHDRNPMVRLVVVAGLIIIIGIAIFTIHSILNNKPTQETKPVLPREIIKPTRPSSPTHQIKSTAEVRLTNKEIRHLNESQTNQLNTAELAYWRTYHPAVPPDKHQPKFNKGKYRIFENRADNDIAFLLAIEPGTQVFGSGDHFARGFEKRFLKSIKQPIVVNPEDSEYDKALKRAVTETKIDLKDRYDHGEDIEKLVLETRNEIQKLGAYRAQVEKMVKKEAAGAKRKGLTDDDLNDLMTAANKMLESKGISPIKFNSITSRALKFQSTVENQ